MLDYFGNLTFEMQKSIVSALLSRRAVNPEAKMPMHILIQCLQGYKDTLPSLFDVLTPSELSLCVEDYRALTLVEQARVREKTKAFDENGVLLYCPKAINDITRQLATYRAYLEAETASVARNAKLKHLKVLKTALSVQSGDKVYYQRLARFTDALNEKMLVMVSAERKAYQVIDLVFSHCVWLAWCVDGFRGSWLLR